MTPTFALVSALLVSQVSLVSGATSPYSDGGSARQVVACNTNDGGCTCAAIGAVDNTSNSGQNCTGQDGAKRAIANLNNCRANCCGDPTVATCYSALMGRNGNQSMCGNQQPVTMEADYTKFSMAAGATASEQLTNCCRTKAIVKCSQVMCALQGGSWDLDSGKYQAKAGQAEVVCTKEDCKTKCCEPNPLMCDAVFSSAPAWCGTNYTPKTLWTMTGAVPPHCQSAATAAMTATFTVSADNASFRTACCTAKPAPTACPADFACPEHYEKKSPMPTTLYEMPQYGHCCQLKTGATSCDLDCTTPVQQEHITFPAAAGTCGDTAKQGCPSSKCGAGQLIEMTKLIANGATATNATIASTCCFDKPVAAAAAGPAPSAVVPAKCSAYFVAALAGEVKAKGTTGSAYMQGASLPILAVAVLMLMKF